MWQHVKQNNLFPEVTGSNIFLTLNNSIPK